MAYLKQLVRNRLAFNICLLRNSCFCEKYKKENICSFQSDVLFYNYSFLRNNISVSCKWKTIFGPLFFLLVEEAPVWTNKTVNNKLFYALCTYIFKDRVYKISAHYKFFLLESLTFQASLFLISFVEGQKRYSRRLLVKFDTIDFTQSPNLNSENPSWLII